MASSLGYNVTMTLPATSRQTRAFDDRADALAHFFLRAGEAPRLLAYDDAVGCPLDQALAALEWTAAVGILAEDDLLHAGRLAADAAAAVVERRDGRSEEHTSELQSLAYLVCRLLLEKKKKKKTQR